MQQGTAARRQSHGVGDVNHGTSTDQHCSEAARQRSMSAKDINAAGTGATTRGCVGNGRLRDDQKNRCGASRTVCEFM